MPRRLLTKGKMVVISLLGDTTQTHRDIVTNTYSSYKYLKEGLINITFTFS